MASHDELLTYAQAAACLGRSETTVRRLIKKGRLKKSRSERRVYVTKTSVDAELSRHSRPDTIGRRDSLLVLGKALWVGASGWAFYLWDKLSKIKESRVEIESLFAAWPRLQVVPGSHHPVEGFHPDTQNALENLAPLIPRRHPIVISGLEELPPADLAHDLLLVGGPVANLISRRLHGYNYDNENDKLSVTPKRKMGLRWCFYYPFPRDDDPDFARYVSGDIRTTMPKAVLDTNAKGRPKSQLFSRYDVATGRIQSDYLLLIVVPNTLCGYSTGFSIIDIVDLHGQGNKIFADLMRDNDRRKELADAVNHMPHFQALYEVPVVHNDASRVTAPGNPTLRDVMVLS